MLLHNILFTINELSYYFHYYTFFSSSVFNPLNKGGKTTSHSHRQGSFCPFMFILFENNELKKEKSFESKN